jgi:hypothetical protein
MANNIPTASGSSASGSTMQPRYMRRIMNTYPVSEPEMELISGSNDRTAARFSIMGFLAGIAATIVITALFTPDLTPEGKVLYHYGAPLLGLFAIGFGIGGFVARWKSGSTWDKIKEDSVPVETGVTTDLRDAAPQAPAPQE